MMRLAIISSVVGTGFITTGVITGSVSIPAFTCRWALPACLALSGITFLLSLANATSRRASQSFTVSQEKHAFQPRF